MKVGIATTTIHTPRALALLMKNKQMAMAGFDVAAFVAADEKTPNDAFVFCATIPHCEIYSVERQKELGYECSALLGWNCIQRRSIAILECLRWGADIIVLWDDDNVALDTGYLNAFVDSLELPFNGIKARSYNGWFDVGQLLDPISPHRGFPHDLTAQPMFEPVIDAKVGVAAGSCLGDPDCSAITRIANHPTVHRVSELLRAGIVVDPNTWTVFNSQNSAFLRELAPCFLMVPQWGRYDDIYASLIAQRVMRSCGLHVHFGQPFVIQERNQHDLVKDLKDEMFGMEHTIEFATWLDSVKGLGTGRSVLEEVKTIYKHINDLPWMPEGVSDLGLSWVEDCTKVCK